MFDEYLVRTTNEAYYNNEPDQRVLEEIEKVKEKLEDVEDDIYLMLAEEGMSDHMEDEIQELLWKKEELREKLKKLEEMVYGSN